MLELFNMKHEAPSALGKKLSKKHFILANLIILFTGLIFLGVLYYILNIQYEVPKTLLSNGPVTSPPRSLRLDLEQPENNSLIFTNSIAVSGKTSTAKEVLIYTDTNDMVIESKPDGSFSGKLDLEEGENRITVAVFDSTGESRSLERTVYYSKEKI